MAVSVTLTEVSCGAVKKNIALKLKGLKLIKLKIKNKAFIIFIPLLQSSAV
jgi:hypothetical protein